MQQLLNVCLSGLWFEFVQIPTMLKDVDEKTCLALFLRWQYKVNLSLRYTHTHTQCRNKMERKNILKIEKTVMLHWTNWDFFILSHTQRLKKIGEVTCMVICKFALNLMNWNKNMPMLFLANSLHKVLHKNSNTNL